MTIEAVIFDFDGLILETEGPIFQSWGELYREFGLDLTLERWAKSIGTVEGTFDPLEDMELLLGRKLDRESLAPRRRQREDELVLSQPVMPGVEDYLRDARRLGLKVGLASSSSCSWVNGHLERLGLRNYFDILRASDDVQCTKPDPDLYLAALGALGVRVDQAFAIEDSPNGALAAKRAGLFCVAVPNELTRRLSLDHADLRLESLTDMPFERLVQEIERRLDGKIY